MGMFGLIKSHHPMLSTKHYPLPLWRRTIEHWRPRSNLKRRARYTSMFGNFPSNLEAMSRSDERAYRAIGAPGWIAGKRVKLKYFGRAFVEAPCHS